MTSRGSDAEQEKPAELREELRAAGLPAARNLAENARQEARRLARLLQRDYGAEAVYLIGSLAGSDEQAFPQHFSIDLAATGIAEDRFNYAAGYLLMETPFRVDLTNLDETPAARRRELLEHAELLVGTQAGA